MKYSVFVPVYNEAGNLERLYEKIKEVMDKLGEWELILVNDGSTDGSLQEMRAIKAPNIRILDMMRNYGQATAMDVGFKESQGDIIISLDADLQNDPQDIPKILQKMEDEDLDVVAGWREKRKDPLWVRVVTKAARTFRRMFIADDVHDSGCTLRAYKKNVVEDLDLWGEMHRYIIALLRFRGAKIGEIKVAHHPRTVGKSKYNWKKSIKGFLDLLYIWFWKKFSSRPLHLFGVLGALMIFMGFLSGLFTVYLKFFKDVDLSNSVWFLLTVFLIILGVQFFITGVMIDLMIRTYYSNSIEKRYKVKKEYISSES